MLDVEQAGSCCARRARRGHACGCGARHPAADAQPSDARAAAADAYADPRAALLKLLPAGSKLEDLRPSPIPGIYEFMQGADVSYLTADGKYFLDGNLYDMARARI